MSAVGVFTVFFAVVLIGFVLVSVTFGMSPGKPGVDHVLGWQPVPGVELHWTDTWAMLSPLASVFATLAVVLTLREMQLQRRGTDRQTAEQRRITQAQLDAQRADADRRLDETLKAMNAQRAEMTKQVEVAQLQLTEAKLQLEQMAAHRESLEEQRMDALRPALIPVNESRVIPYQPRISLGREGGDALTLRNVGVGPALSVSVTIRRKATPDDPEDEGEIVLKGEHTGAPAMAPLELGTVVQWAGKEPFEVQTGDLLEIYYEDVHGRSFQTTVFRYSAGWLEHWTGTVTDRFQRYSATRSGRN